MIISFVSFLSRDRLLSYSLNVKEYEDNLPLLKNDTNNIITYINDLEEFKNKRKKRFWEELITN